MRTDALLLVLALPMAANADIVNINWSGETFSHRAIIAPQKFLEVCGKLQKGESVAWQFKGSGSTDFNIHFHVGKEVTYPENRKAVASADGVLAVPLDQDFCWMWTNNTAQPVDIEVGLKQAKPGN